MRGQILKKNELAEEIGITTKSIQLDIEDIRDYLDKKHTIEGSRSQLVYNHYEKGYCMKEFEQLKLSTSEVLAISKILLESRAFTKKEMMNILDKLIENCIPWKNRAEINVLLNNERFHYVELRHHKKFLDKITPLTQAIRGCNVIQIKYGKLKESAIVERRLEPLAIIFSEYYFYLVGFIEDINKEETFENPDDIFPTIYRIDRIQELEVLDEHFKISYAKRFEEGEFRKRVQFMYGGKLRKVRFQCKETSLEAILDRLPTARTLSEENGRYLIEVEVFGKGIDIWVRSQGDNIMEYTII